MTLTVKNNELGFVTYVV